VDTFTSLLTRRSIRKYDGRPVPKEIIRKLLSAAMNAPSAGNQQPWRFVVVNERKTLDAVADIHPHGKMLKHAPLAIIVCGELSVEKHKGYWVQDCAAATQNVLLAAHDLGLGAVWLGVYPREERMKNIGDLLNMPDGVLPFCVVSVGWPAETKEPESRYDEKKVHWNGW